MFPIFRFEWRYRLTRPATWIYGLILFVLGIVFMTSDAVRIGGGYGKVLKNAPFNIHMIESIMAAFGMFFVMAFMAVPILRDSDHKMDAFLYAFPIKKRDYYLGRFLGSLSVCLFAFALLPLGMMLGEALARTWETDPGTWGDFSFSSYAWPFLVAIFPNVFFMGALFFTLVTLSRKMMYGYLVAIFSIVFYGAALSALSDLENKDLASTLDPFGLLSTDRVTDYWAIAEKNTSLVPLVGTYLVNRLGILLIACLILLFGYRRFRMSPVSDSGKPLKPEADAQAKGVQPTQAWKPNYAIAPLIRSLTLLEIRQTLRSPLFLALLFAITLFLGFNAWNANKMFETSVYPVTGIMLEGATNSIFSILSIVTLVFLAGEIVWRERQVHMEGIYDAFPVPGPVVFISKLLSLMVVPVCLLLLVPIASVAVQWMKGYHEQEWSLYFKTLFLFELPRLWLMAFLAFAIQQILNNKFAGHVAMLGYYLSILGLSYLHIEHPLFRFASGMNYRYSDMNGFGDFVHPYRIYLLHWSFTGLFLLVLAWLFMVRGAESDFRSRLRFAIQRVKESWTARLVVLLPFLAMMGTGYYITYQTLVLDHFTNSKEEEEISAEYEKKFAYLEESLHPSLKAVSVGADLFPENGDLHLTGKFIYFNPHKKPIDTLWFNFNPEGKLEKLAINLPGKTVFDDPDKGIRAIRLAKSLAPADSFELDFAMKLGYTGLNNESPVKENGTFFNTQYWPSMGFNDAYRIQDDDKRKEYGLQEMPTLPSQTDSLATDRGFLDPGNHNIRFEAVVSTSPDQIAIAPGYLLKEWNEKGRRYFHYKMDIPIVNFYAILSARYQVYKENWKGIDISVYHHPAHGYNVKKMAEAVRHSLEYYGEHFGPYQHKQVRILEFPRYQSFAQSFDNTIPYSEAIGFIANLEEEDAIDYVYFVTAHEMAHQWWGHQINPASTRGCQFLSETMAEYSALMVMKKRYGENLMGRFLRRELDSYLNGRSGEKKKENPLMDIEYQQYAYYNKGSMAMYSVMDLIGEEKMNQFLGSFVKKYAFAERPYVTTHQYYDMLKTHIPAPLQVLADDQLKRITLYKNRVVSAKGKKRSDGLFEVTLVPELGKMYVDSLGGNEQNKPFAGSIGVALQTKEFVVKPSEVLVMEKKELVSGKPLVLVSKQKPTYVSLDPLHTLTDIKPEDNTLKIDWE